jgi:hypothetical protein
MDLTTFEHDAVTGLYLTLFQGWKLQAPLLAGFLGGLACTGTRVPQRYSIGESSAALQLYHLPNWLDTLWY